MAHAFSPSYIAQGSCNKLRITILHCSFQISRNIIGSSEVCGWVPDCRGGFSHWLLLEISSKIFGESDVLVLRTLITACKQNDEGISLLCQIDPSLSVSQEIQICSLLPGPSNYRFWKDEDERAGRLAYGQLKARFRPHWPTPAANPAEAA